MSTSSNEPKHASKSAKSTSSTKSAKPAHSTGAATVAVATTDHPAAGANAVVAPPSSAPPAPPPSPSPTPLDLRVESALALVKQAIAIMAIASPPLTGAEVKAATKFRKGGEAHIPTLADLSGTYGVEVPSRPTAEMQANLAEAQTLAPLVALVVRFLGTLESASFQVRSETWATATTLYQMLRTASTREPALKAELVPLEEFFRYRHPLVRDTAPPTAAKLAKETKRQENAAKKLQRLQNAVAAAAGKPGGAVLSDVPTPAPAATPVAPANGAPPAHA